ncbi:hypothetical protein AAFX91_40395 [Bradyrhizobium sp. 31Argb]|uniref:hypothetical protein n=1 Tax=unclassified Bradyrhizobium TaxID=2631580 RepID=UPI0013EEA046
MDRAADFAYDTTVPPDIIALMGRGMMRRGPVSRVDRASSFLFWVVREDRDAGRVDLAFDHDPIGRNRIMISSLCWSMISAQTLRVCREGKPVSTFPDQALTGILLSPLFQLAINQRLRPAYRERLQWRSHQAGPRLIADPEYPAPDVALPGFLDGELNPLVLHGQRL